MAQQAEHALPADPPAKPSKPWLLLGALVLSLGIGGGGAAWFLFSRQGAAEVAPAAATAKQEKNQVPASTEFFILEPSFVVNFELPSPVRFLQVTVELELNGPADREAVEKHLPVIRNNLLLLFGSQDYEQLRTRAGKERLREAALEEVRAILNERAGHAGVVQVYFTHFVMQ